MYKVIKSLKIIVALSAVCVGCSSASTSLAKAREKALKEQYTQKMKFFKKNKYKITGTSRSLELALIDHYQKLESDQYEEIEVTSEGCPTVNLCARKSLVDAQSQYAALASSFVKGKAVSEGGYNAAGTSEEEKAAMDKFYSAYAQYVSADISGRIKKSLAVLKKTSGGYEYVAYYLVEKEAARMARMAALKKAQKETEANIKWGQTVEDWVNQTPTK